MPNTIFSLVTGFPAVVLALSLLFTGAGASAAELDALRGNWLTRLTNENGRAYSQRLQFQEDKLRLDILDEAQQTLLVVKATVKAERQGPFQILAVRNISAGRSEAELESTEYGGSLIFMLHDSALYVASYFDRYQENRPPKLDVYRRPEAWPAPASGPDLSGTWDLEVKVNDQEFDYELKLVRNGARWIGTIVSPRSGPHGVDTVEVKDGALRMVVARKLDDADATFTYQGKLVGTDRMSGDLTIRVSDNEVSGKWTAEKP